MSQKPLLFGKKYNGTMMCMVPQDYIDWLTSQQIFLVETPQGWVRDTNRTVDLGSKVITLKKFKGKTIRQVFTTQEGKDYYAWMSLNSSGSSSISNLMKDVERFWSEQ